MHDEQRRHCNSVSYSQSCSVSEVSRDASRAGFVAPKTFSTRHSSAPDDMLIVMMSGAKHAASTRKPRRTLPSAERRLRASFPEVWAWYELIATARGVVTIDPAEPEDAPRRTSARR
ncbi:MAG: hypothetical protein ABI080_20795 [Candidatus Binatia bacterium]